MPVTHIAPAPQSQEGFYAMNNPFLVNGPKDFMESKTLENEDTYMRIDLPGLPKNSVNVWLDESIKAICISGEAPKEHKHDSSHRSYDGSTLRPKLRIHGINSKIVCQCCEFYSVFTSLMSDGVLRLVLTKIHNATTPRPPCIYPPWHDFSQLSRHGTDPHDPKLTGGILRPNPGVRQGSVMAYESKMLQNGGLYVRVDMPMG